MYVQRLVYTISSLQFVLVVSSSVTHKKWPQKWSKIEFIVTDQNFRLVCLLLNMRDETVKHLELFKPAGENSWSQKQKEMNFSARCSQLVVFSQIKSNHHLSIQPLSWLIGRLRSRFSSRSLNKRLRVVTFRLNFSVASGLYGTRSQGNSIKSLWREQVSEIDRHKK